MQQYFARISSQLRPANKLQEYLLRQVQKYDNVLLDDSETLFKEVEKCVLNAKITYRRCTPTTPRLNRDHKTREMSSIGAGGLFTLSFHKVVKTYTYQVEPTQPAPEPVSTSPEPEPAPKASEIQPEPEAGPAPIHQPRQAICKSRDDDTPVELLCIDEFSPFIQRLLQTGNVWRIYKNNEQTLLEEYGGKTHLIIPT